MDLRVSEETVEGVTVLGLVGEVDLATLPQLHGRLLRSIGQQPGGVVVVDLDGVLAIDDSGLGALVGAAGRLRARGGDLLLVCSEGRVLELMRRTRLDRALDVHPTRAAAVTAARGRRAAP